MNSEKMVTAPSQPGKPREPGANVAIPFSQPSITDLEKDLVMQALASNQVAGDNSFTKRCEAILAEQYDTQVLLTSSGTHALEMAALLVDVQPGDEVILPALTFPSTATSFVMRGAVPVFVDIDRDTLNLDHRLLRKALTDKTKAIVTVHYGGVTGNIETLQQFALDHNIPLVEDNAHGHGAHFNHKPLGTFGSLGCLSFHETKNLTAGEGGALIINDKTLAKRAEIIREKGTNRSAFFRGDVDKYTWLDLGSSYLMSDVNAALLLGQLTRQAEVYEDRLRSWQHFYDRLLPLHMQERLRLPVIPKGSQHNAHLFYVLCQSQTQRDDLITFLRQHGIHATHHYLPLHTSPAGQRFGRLGSQDVHTTEVSQRLIRLPLYFGLSEADIAAVCARIYEFYQHAY